MAKRKIVTCISCGRDCTVAGNQKKDTALCPRCSLHGFTNFNEAKDRSALPPDQSAKFDPSDDSIDSK